MYQDYDFDEDPFDTENHITFKTAAKIIGIPGYGRNNIMSLLRESGFLDKKNQVTPEYSKASFFVEVRSFGHCPYATKQFNTLRVLPAGLELIKKLIKSKLNQTN